MPTESGFSNQKKLGQSQFKTVHSLGSDKFGQSVASKALFEKVASAEVVDASEVLGPDGRIQFINIQIPLHGAIVNDVFRLDDGDLINYEFDILSIVDDNNFLILPIADVGFFPGAFGSIMGWVTNKANADGSQIVSVIIAGGATEAKQQEQIDLATATGATIDDISANIGAVTDISEPDPTQDASVISAVKGVNENLQSIDFATETTLADLNSKDFATETTLAAIAALDFSTEAKQDTQILEAQTANTLLNEINTDLGSSVSASEPDPAQAATVIAAIKGVNQNLRTIDFSTGAKQDAQSALIGAATETAPANDTASSGLNGRLQRIAQRITSLIALLPASLGQKTMANSLAVTLASDQSSIPINSTPATVAGTVTSAQAAVGLTAVRATVSGSAPSAARKLLKIKPNINNSGRIWIGASGVTISTGLEIVGPDTMTFEFDSGDYYLISDTAAQSVDILEKA